MKKVVALSAYRREKGLQTCEVKPRHGIRPQISDVDIWGRDYSVLDNIVYGVLKIHDIVSHFVYPDEYWLDALICLLDAASKRNEQGPEPLHDAAERIAGLILLWMDEFNRKDMYAALLILGLIEKSIPSGQPEVCEPKDSLVLS